MARWTAFKPRGHFSFDARSVQTQWPQLHAADCEPLPDDRHLLEGWALFHNGRYLLGDSATRPTEPLNMSSSGAPGALLRLTVRIFRAVARCVVAPTRHIPMTAHSDVSNCRF